MFDGLDINEGDEENRVCREPKKSRKLGEKKKKKIRTFGVIPIP